MSAFKGKEVEGFPVKESEQKPPETRKPILMIYYEVQDKKL